MCESFAVLNLRGYDIAVNARRSRLWLHVSLLYYSRRPTFWELEGPQVARELLPERFEVRPCLTPSAEPLVPACLELATKLDNNMIWMLAYFKLDPSEAAVPSVALFSMAK